MKNFALIITLLTFSYNIFAQTLNETETGGLICNSSLDNTDPSQTGCIDAIALNTTSILGKLGGDDGNDYYAFPTTSATITISYTLSPSFSFLLKIFEYTGTIGTDGATVGTGTTIAASGTSFTFNPTKKYVLYAENAAGGGAIDARTYTITFNAPLPVELISFKGQATENGVQLEWKTAQEKNSKAFEIQRSSDALDYQNIGLVEASGNSQSLRVYQFLDQNPIDGINYYRLKQIDVDNTFALLRPISITVSKNEDEWTIYPNPSAKNLQFSASFVQNLQQLSIYDLNGKLIKPIAVTDLQNNQLNIEELPAGAYLLKAQSAIRTQTKVFIVR